MGRAGEVRWEGLDWRNYDRFIGASSQHRDLMNAMCHVRHLDSIKMTTASFIY